MAITDKKISELYPGRDISSLSDRPNQDGMTGDELKARFDQLGKEVIPKHNDLIDELVVELANARSVYVGDTEPTEPKEIWIDTDEIYDVDVDFIQGIPAIEQARVDTEAQRIIDENLRLSQELDRVSNESTRGTQESTRQSQESIRQSQESIRQSNETTRGNNENTRQSQETLRNNAEVIRLSSEITRSNNEVTRQSQESSRVSAENIRVTSENARNVFVAYNSATSYVVGNKVSYLGSSYVCILNSLNNLPTNSTYWLLIAQKGDNTTADSVTNTPSGNISSTTVQGALNELDTEKAPTVHTHDDRYYTETELNNGQLDTRYYTETESNTLLANKTDKLFATNLVTNGDFSNGITGWNLSSNVTLTNVSGYGHVEMSIAGGSRGINQIGKCIVGNKYYIRTDIRATDNSLIRLGLDVGVDYNLIPNTWKSISTIFTAVTDAFRIYKFSTNIGDYFDVDNVLCKDLTVIFGTGKEPTKEQIDWLLAQNFTNSWFDGTKELNKISNLIVTKADMNYIATPIFINYSNGIIDVISKYGLDKDIRVTIKRKGPNSLYEFYRWNIINNTNKLPSSDITVGTLLYESATDHFTPYHVNAVNNADGTNKVGEVFNDYYTGGNHNYNNTGAIGEGLATARHTAISVLVNGKIVSDGFSGYANFIDLVWTNNIQGQNTTKSDGTGREIMTEKIRLHFDGDKWSVENEITALEAIKIKHMYGLAFAATGWDVNKIYFRGSALKRGYYTASGVGDNSSDKKCNVIKSIGASHTIEMGIDNTFDLGDFAKSVNAYSAVTGNAKAYFHMVYQTPSNAIALLLDDKIGFRGYYKFYPTI